MFYGRAFGGRVARVQMVRRKEVGQRRRAGRVGYEVAPWPIHNSKAYLRGSDSGTKPLVAATNHPHMRTVANVWPFMAPRALRCREPPTQCPSPAPPTPGFGTDGVR